MGEIKLLDCTMRDGGYLNDWNFGHDNLINIFERLVDAKVDIIEIGFLDERRLFDINRSIMPDTDSVEKIFGRLDKKSTIVVGMIDYGTCSIKNIKPCKDSFLDGIRVIFKKHLREPAMQYCAQLKALGYKVFTQLVSVTSYEEAEMMDLIRIANEVQPYAVSMVDTYGLMHQDNLKHYLNLLDKNLNGNIGLGYHAHNNFQMGYANCIEMLSHKTERMLVVDGSIYGMGKSAGNTPVELIMMYMNHKLGKDYHVSQILEAIDSTIMNFYRTSPWGYSMPFYLAASNDCHPSYVFDLMGRRTLSVKSINEILNKLEDSKRLFYDKEYMEKLYRAYQNHEVDDTEDIACLRHIFKDKKILILGPGNNVKRQKKRIDEFINRENPIIIAINFIGDKIKPDYIFLSNSKRYIQLASVLAQQNNTFKIIATSNVTKTSNKFDFTLKYSELLDEEAEVIDNSLVMLLKVMIKTNVKSIYLGGFDGYIGDNNQDYFNPDMEYNFTKEQAESLNIYVRKIIKNIHDKLSIVFLTDSLYV